jgi:hypothetical protein
VNNYDEDLADEWMAEMADDVEDLRDNESTSLTWDDEWVRETHRKVAIRALRASFGWSARNVA